MMGEINMSLKSFSGSIKIFGLIGAFIGECLFILMQIGFEIPVVIGTTSYKGMTASLFLLIGSPIVLIVIGMIVAIFTTSSRTKKIS